MTRLSLQDNILTATRYRSEILEDRVVGFFKRLKHTKGEWGGKYFQLQDWQENEILRPLFGTVWADGMRCYRKAYISTARKNGKTELGAGIALYMLTADGEQGAEIYSCAGDKEQASLVFNAAKLMVETNKSLRKKCKIIASQKRIVYKPTNSFYRVISADAKFKHGFNAHCVIYDELHVARNRELWDVLGTSMKARRQPLMIAITTAGFDLKTICGEQYTKAKDILSGKKKDPTYFAFIRETTTKDKMEDPKTWLKANPGLGTMINMRDIQAEILETKDNPVRANIFLQLTLNQWTQAHSPWILEKIWKASAGPKIDLESLKGLRCYGGLDLATVNDIAAWVKTFPFYETVIDKETGKEKQEVEKVIQIYQFFIPEENMRARSLKENMKYDQWHAQGYITATPGNVIDFSRIKSAIQKDAEIYDLQNINFDPWNAASISQELEEEAGRPEDKPFMIQIRMGMGSLSEPTKQFEILVRKKKLWHGNNPVMTWMMGNVAILRDTNDNIRPDKKKSKEKIDGVVAGIISLDRVLRSPPGSGRSVYEKGGLKIV
jgi:phage terminase large subunit-like protein